MKTVLIISSLGALGLATACGPIRVPGDAVQPDVPEETQAEPAAPVLEAPVETATVTSKRATIDWESARNDFASRQSSDDDAVTVASGSGAPPVPVLLPSTPITTASAGDPSALQFRPTADGYSAVLPGEAYDIIINGTDRLTSAPGRGSVATDTELRFEDTMTGPQIAFSRYGASYLVQFACKGTAAITGDGCISEDEAKAAVQDLLLAGTR